VITSKNTGKNVFVLVQCEYFRKGMQSIFNPEDITFHFMKCIDDIVSYDDTSTILLVLDMSSSESLRKIMNAIDFLNQINSHKRVGVLVSRYNAYLTYYISRKFRGKVTFFNAHNFNSGLFRRNFLSWLGGRTFRPMRVVSRYRDTRYGFSLKEWISLVIPLSGEPIQEIATHMNTSVHSLYQVRQFALRKMGITSYRQFCELFINGEICTENNTLTRTHAPYKGM
jgi:hypothetical protein